MAMLPSMQMDNVARHGEDSSESPRVATVQPTLFTPLNDKSPQFDTITVAFGNAQEMMTLSTELAAKSSKRLARAIEEAKPRMFSRSARKTVQVSLFRADAAAWGQYVSFLETGGLPRGQFPYETEAFLESIMKAFLLGLDLEDEAFRLALVAVMETHESLAYLRAQSNAPLPTTVENCLTIAAIAPYELASARFSSLAVRIAVREQQHRLQRDTWMVGKGEFVGQRNFNSNMMFGGEILAAVEEEVEAERAAWRQCSVSRENTQQLASHHQSPGLKRARSEEEGVDVDGVEESDDVTGRRNKRRRETTDVMGLIGGSIVLTD
ncbi:hypothetical protein KC323_g8031 [Hortaea werneckii]|nr:hypothetical protein KC323_g8031 [Hortaea werneckii]